MKRGFFLKVNRTSSNVANLKHTIFFQTKMLECLRTANILIVTSKYWILLEIEAYKITKSMLSDSDALVISHYSYCDL